jgi:hypothetical protein
MIFSEQKTLTKVSISSDKFCHVGVLGAVKCSYKPFFQPEHPDTSVSLSN